MEPLKPETKARILEERPQASPQDIEEYERLLSERFASDPDLVIAAAQVARLDESREQRLQELHAKLFGRA